jgi:hypothetical protein
MPQLDIYTFSTQIYFMAFVAFVFLVIFSYVLTYILFFESEVFEKDELELNRASIVTKYEQLVISSRYQFLATRLADVVVLFFRK